MKGHLWSKLKSGNTGASAASNANAPKHKASRKSPLGSIGKKK